MPTTLYHDVTDEEGRGGGYTLQCRAELLLSAAPSMGQAVVAATEKWAKVIRAANIRGD
jgi:hypothetical protein